MWLVGSVREEKKFWRLAFRELGWFKQITHVHCLADKQAKDGMADIRRLLQSPKPAEDPVSWCLP